MNTKYKTPIRCTALCCVLLVTGMSARASFPIYFSDNFESGLGQWTGNGGGAHHGVIVADPLSSGRGSVLTFSTIVTGGDIFTTDIFPSATPFTITFDYLGLAKPGSVAGDFGGFIGIQTGLGVGAGRWVGGTSASGLDGSLTPTSISLPDDGQWHTFSITLTGPGSSFHLMMEDWIGSSGVAGDSYFDNIQITAVPEPAGFAFCGLTALVLFARRVKMFKRLS